MDLLGTLSSQLGIDNDQAGALAGSILGKVQGQVDEDTASGLAAAVPELDGWKAMAAKAVGGDSGGMLGGAAGALGGGSAGGLMGALAGAVGGQQAQETAALVGVMGKLGLDRSKAAMVAPIVLDFVKDRVDPALLSKVLAAAPMLTALTGGGSDDAAPPSGMAAVTGALGGLFG